MVKTGSGKGIYCIRTGFGKRLVLFRNRLRRRLIRVELPGCSTAHTHTLVKVTLYCL
jgi:hypothetical protein